MEQGARAVRRLDAENLSRMADSIEGLIYAEAQRGLALQPVLLNELRARTGMLLALITAVTSFLGALVIDNDNQTLGCWGVTALGAFGVAVLCCLGLLSPLWKWDFTQGAADLISNYGRLEPDDRYWTESQVQRDMALHMEGQMKAAISKMKWMQWLYVLAGISLAVEIASWIAELAT